MRSSAVRLLRLKPIPISQVPGAVRLPPSQSRPTAASASSTSSTASSSTRKASSNETVMASLMERQAKAKEAQQPFPENLRFEEFIHGKQLYWKVPREEREKLAKELKEA